MNKNNLPHQSNLFEWQGKKAEKPTSEDNSVKSTVFPSASSRVGTGAGDKPGSPLPSSLPPQTPLSRLPEKIASQAYTAASIEVLEGLEAVRRRPGMYVGGTDETALHHLFAEVLDNAMDEVIAGHATRIEVGVEADGSVTVTDNGRGIPVDAHPKFPDKSALEVIMTTLHAGGKFDSKVYETSGGLNGVGISVVNALSQYIEVEVARNQILYRQRFSQGKASTPLEEIGKVYNRRGTKVHFQADPEIFVVSSTFRPEILFRMARAKAYLFAGVEIRWRCAPEQLGPKSSTPTEKILHFPGGLQEYLAQEVENKERIVEEIFAGQSASSRRHGGTEWAIIWLQEEAGFIRSYCNTIPTPEGGTHELGLRMALLKGLKGHAERTGQGKRGALLTSEDVMQNCAAVLSFFFHEPEFQGQNKTKLMSAEAARLVETRLRESFEHWLADSPAQSAKLFQWIAERAEERIRRRAEKEIQRKHIGHKLRLPGKLADCTHHSQKGSELFIVEGDSAGGSAKQARDRAFQAILPLKGKILNVANAPREKFLQNQQLMDLVQALGCGIGPEYRASVVRYEKVIIMTDADVDGAHIASLLLTFFHRQMPKLIEEGHLYLAVPPLYRLTQGTQTFYARDEKQREEIVQKLSKRGAIEVSRFKGLGEMNALQLKETTMNVQSRSLLKVLLKEEDKAQTAKSVERLMGAKAEGRFSFIQERAEFGTKLVDI